MANEKLRGTIMKIQEIYSVQPREDHHVEYWREQRAFITNIILQAFQEAVEGLECPYRRWYKERVAWQGAIGAVLGLLKGE